MVLVTEGVDRGASVGPEPGHIFRGHARAVSLWWGGPLSAR
jgi:hypothetical protein